MKSIGIISAGTDVTDHYWSDFLHTSEIGDKWEYDATGHEIFIDCKKAYDAVRREVLYTILIEFGVLMKLVRLIKMRLKEAYNKGTAEEFFWTR
jgi:hypothetical protein